MATERGDTPVRSQSGTVDYSRRAVPTDREVEAMPYYGSMLNALDELDTLYEHFLQVPRWPRQISDRALEDAAKLDPQINSPYTRVRNTPEGLVADPYHEVFKDELLRVVMWVNSARLTASTQDPALAQYLEAIIDELSFGGEERRKETVRRWLAMDHEPIADLVCGFSDRYDDERGMKFSPQGWAGILDESETDKLRGFIEKQLAAWAEITPDYAPKHPVVRGRVNQSVRFAGLARNMEYSANNMPSEQSLRDEFGAKITVLPSFYYRLENTILPILGKIIPRQITRGWSPEVLQDAALFGLGAHEVSHSLIRREGDQERLSRDFNYMNEMYAEALGLALIGRRQDLTTQTREQILAAHLASTIARVQEYQKGQDKPNQTPAEARRERRIRLSKKSYLDGHATIFNTLIERKVIRIDNTGLIRWDNIDDVYSVIDEFARVALEGMARCGDAKMARNLRRTDGGLETVMKTAPLVGRSLASID